MTVCGLVIGLVIDSPGIDIVNLTKTCIIGVFGIIRPKVGMQFSGSAGSVLMVLFRNPSVISCPSTYPSMYAFCSGVGVLDIGISSFGGVPCPGWM